MTVSLNKLAPLKLDISSEKKPSNFLTRNLATGLKVNTNEEEYQGLLIYTNDNIRIIDYLKDEE